MRVDRRLNIVVPVETAEGEVFVHSTPISSDAFRRYYLLIAKTFAKIYNQGLGALAGPRVAAHLLRDAAIEQAGPLADEEAREAAGREAEGLLAEIRRLSNVAAPTREGWATIPYQEAIDRGAISKEDADDVENILVFFIVASAMQRGEELDTVRKMTGQLYDARFTSQNYTAWVASLPTSTATDNSDSRPTPSSIPS